MSRIAVYLTGGIAAYKAVEVVRGLQKQGHQVRVVMTENAEHFVAKQTLAALTKYPVLDNLWVESEQAKISHIELADWSELALVVPATANIIAKLAYGLADDAASTTLLATSSPILVVPAMNSHMWSKPSTQRNISQIKADGVKVLEPVVGRLAEGYSGKGRMPEVSQVLAWVDSFLSNSNSDKRIVITAGGTLEPIDPVRYIGNRSSGKMGIALAKAAASAGFKVDLIVGNISVDLPDDINIKVSQIETTEQMLKAVKENFEAADVLIMAAAVADYRVKNYVNHKIKKQAKIQYQLDLEETPDILKTIGALKRPDQLVIGFAAETNDLLENATKKLESKNADIIVANDVSKNVFGNDEDEVTILQKKSCPLHWQRMDKSKIAKRLIKLVEENLIKK
ncbi:phosphopantothenoylcysteine decarboxylase/phosphopantothenate--cysteine ligase [Lactobacillus colini]|uniref:Coenzyme A biosynthesis bifunctional protein CoaBC n=1 Tax=Lactobacillus colini TaxID=1819254 RepID=A0ABS4MDW4_9LACO|nr:phosphopantothenoylcysteine decarboxylase/phosphopantothenate--cysteine ligase [Lactobacillus colini]